MTRDWNIDLPKKKKKSLFNPWQQVNSSLYLRCYALMLGTILFTISVGRYTTIYSDPPNWKDETVISPQPYILSPCQGTIYSHGNGWMKNKWFSSHNFLPSTVALSLWKVIGTVSFGKYHLNSAFINFSFSFFNSKITAWVGENSIANKDWTKAESWSHLMWCWH